MVAIEIATAPPIESIGTATVIGFRIARIDVRTTRIVTSHWQFCAVENGVEPDFGIA
jgi:hypothetical protein